MLFHRLPIPESLRAAKLSFKFTGPDDHSAPMSATPLSDAMLGKTNAAVITLIAGVVLVAARRLEALADTTRLHHLAECLLCYERSPLYYSGYRRPKPTATPTKAEQTVSAIFTKSTAVFQQTPKKHSSFPPMQALKNVVSLAELVLGEEHIPYLRQFLESSIARLNQCAANPAQVFTTRSNYDSDAEWAEVIRRNFGVPVPLEALDTAKALETLDLNALYQDMLSEADWRTNPYLTPTDAMRSAGFAGDPYPVGR